MTPSLLLSGGHNQNGLTLIEVLVSIVILASGSVFVLQALAQSAGVQRRVEDNMRLYPWIAAKLAQTEMRVSPEKNPFKPASGTYTEEKIRYQWNTSNVFHNPLEADLPVESLGKSVLLERTIHLYSTLQSAADGIQLITLIKAPIPENQT